MVIAPFKFIMGHDPRDFTVLVAIINRRKDLEILLTQNWYRIPVAKLPARPFGWLAFYHTSALGKEGKLIRYYAQVKQIIKTRRKDLLPDEKNHRRYGEEYYKFVFERIKELTRPIHNSTSMRFTFGFTTLARLLRFRSLHSLFGVRPLERIFRQLLKKHDVPFFPEYPIKCKGRVRYRLDLAIFCRKGQINIECDMPKYHSGKRRAYDRRRNQYLRRRGWTVLRFSDEDILFNAPQCFTALNDAILRLGGIC